MMPTRPVHVLLLVIVSGILNAAEGQRARDRSLADSRYADSKRVVDAGGEEACRPERRQTRTIIKTKDSIAQGAIFLQAPTNLTSLAGCLRYCCALPSCTTAIVKQVG